MILDDTYVHVFSGRPEIRRHEYRHEEDACRGMCIRTVTDDRVGRDKK